MNGKLIAGFLVCAGAIAGVVLWYTSYIAFYDELPSQDSIVIDDRAFAIENFQGIDAQSSPLKLRACFEFEDVLPDPEAFSEDPTPLIAPGWFSCFDAESIAKDLVAGKARAVLAASNEPFGFDQIVVLYEDGRGFMWRQMNECGKRHFDRKPMPPGCPDPEN